MSILDWVLGKGPIITPGLMAKEILWLLPRLPRQDSEFKSEADFACPSRALMLPLDDFSKNYLRPSINCMLNNKKSEFDDKLGYLMFAPRQTYNRSTVYIYDRYNGETDLFEYYIFMHYVPYPPISVYFWLGGSDENN